MVTRQAGEMPTSGAYGSGEEISDWESVDPFSGFGVEIPAYGTAIPADQGPTDAKKRLLLMIDLP